MTSRLLTAGDQETLANPLINRRAAVRHCCGRNILSQAARAAKGKTLPVKIFDISVGGVALILRSALKPGTLLLIQLKNQALQISYDLAARVVHSRPAPRGQWVVGCVFARELSPLELDTLL